MSISLDFNFDKFDSEIAEVGEKISRLRALAIETNALIRELNGLGVGVSVNSDIDGKKIARLLSEVLINESKPNDHSF
jgi:hypothetical protein